MSIVQSLETSVVAPRTASTSPLIKRNIDRSVLRCSCHHKLSTLEQ
jgi:hypothetical protein